MTKPSFLKIRQIAVVAAVLTSLAAASAEAGTTALIFEHPAESTIVEFRVQIWVPTSPTDAFDPAVDSEISVQVPPKQGGRFVASVPIPDDVDVNLAIISVDAWGQRSLPSNAVSRRTSSSGASTLGAAPRPTVSP